MIVERSTYERDTRIGVRTRNTGICTYIDARRNTRDQTLGIDCSAVGGLRFMSSEPRPE